MTRKILCAVFAVLTVLWIVFVFSNSMENAQESTEKSDVVYEVVNDAAQSIGIEQEITHHTIRQGGHFVEFFVLGALAAATAVAAFVPLLSASAFPRLFIAFASLPFSAAIAVTDEYIQTFSDGRVCDIEDVFTDAAGAFFGLAIVVAAFLLLKYFVGKRLKKRADDRA